MNQRSRLRSGLLRLAAGLVGLSVDVASAQTVVDQCGQIVSDSAVLAADLDCSAYDAGPAITLDGGTLDFQGHQVIGSPNLPTEFPFEKETAVIFCTPRVKCTIVGPGTVTGARYGISANLLALKNVTITANSALGIHAYRDPKLDDERGGAAKIRVTNATVSGNGGTGIAGGSWARCTVTDSTIVSNAGDGVGCDHVVDVRRSVVSMNGGDGVACSGGQKTSVSECTVTSNGEAGVHSSSDSIKIQRSDISGNGAGVFGGFKKAKVTDSTLMNNTGYGWRSHRPAIRTSIVFKGSALGDNCIAPEPDTECADLHVCGTAPELVETTCGTSHGCSAGSVLGICTMD